MLLEVDSLDAFHGGVQALWNVSLDVSDGECVCVLGSNGAGKTTLLSAIAGLLRAKRGAIRYGGESIDMLSAHAICRRRLALVPEGGQLFPEMTVLENLEVGAFAARARAKRNLERYLQMFPRLRERARLPAGALSGGERQLLAIARALMSEPKLLLLDEPSLGLAPVAVDYIFEVLAGLRHEGLSILLVEQNISHALELADRAYVIQTGRVVSAGTAAALAQDTAIRQHYLGL